MPTGTNVAVLKDNQILLIQREDMYRLRDESGLSRTAYAFKLFGEDGDTRIELSE